MRLIKTFSDENNAKRFSFFLIKEKIENQLDEMIDENNHYNYQLWVLDEDKIAKAKKLLDDFEKNPKDKMYDVSLKDIYPEKKDILESAEDSLNQNYDENIKENEEIDEDVYEEEIDEGNEEAIDESENNYRKEFSKTDADSLIYKKKHSNSKIITSLILMVCIFFYILNFLQEKNIKKSYPKSSYVLLTPVQKEMMFDVPLFLIQLNDIFLKYPINPGKPMEKQSPDIQKEVDKLEKMTFFRGYYELLVSKDRKEYLSSLKWSDFFIKIKEGQVWRLFSPCLFHKDFLHLLFNMLWLWLLGIQIESRLSKFKYIFFILLVGVISNIFQYLVTGPNFIGFSGVITGMVGFIFARQKKAPWEGYPLQKGVYLFIGVYIFLMFLLSLFSFISEFFQNIEFGPNIANTAHIVGAIAGYLLGKLSFFSWSRFHEQK